MAECQGALERGTAEIKITVLGADILATVGVLLDGERRGLGLVKDIQRFNFDFDVACRHLRVLAFALENLTGDLDDIFAAKARITFENELCDAITVPEVNECHTAEAAGLLDPACEGYLLSFVGDTEFATSVASVHIKSGVTLVTSRKIRKLS